MPCPRCNHNPLREKVVENALSRTTRGEDDDPVYVCSNCGVDEAIEEHFVGVATPQRDWPVGPVHGRILQRLWKGAAT